MTLLSNVKSKVVLFGGDLSWANDYIEGISLLAKENKEIEIYFPITKFASMSKERRKEFDDRITSLRQVGAKVFSIPKDYGLRCIMVDPDFSDSNKHMQVMITERLESDLKNKNRNKYITQSFAYDIEKRGHDNDRNICMSLKIVYNGIKKEEYYGEKIK